MSGTTVMLLRSTDTGAPRLSGTAGDITTLLDACLVNGYNSRTLTSITRSGTTATATFNGHGYAADGLSKIKISGANETEYNGTFIITNVTTNTFDYTVTGTPATPATGTITSVVAPLGWGKPFSGTSLAAYRSAEVTGTRLYLRVDDTGTTIARVRGFETMTDVNTGTGLFPTDLMSSGGLWISKSDLASTAARKWVLVGDGFEFHFFYVCNATIYDNIYRQFHFGDPASEMASDPYGCLIYGDTASSLAQPNIGSSTWSITTASNFTQVPGFYFARLYTQTGTSVGACIHGNVTLATSIIGIGTAITYPSPANNGLYITPLFVGDTSVLRSQLKGIYQPLQTRPLGHGTLLYANVSPISRRLYAVATAYSSTTPGETHIDIDGPWR